MFQGDLNAKLVENVKSLDFNTLPCNCRQKKACLYDGKCRTSIVVYKATDIATGKIYIGNTQQHVKTRMQQHVQDVRKLYISEKSSDSFAAHFAKGIPMNVDKKTIKDFIKFKVDIIWHGNPLSCVKTFGTRGCKLCAMERLEILKLTRTNRKLAINKCNEVYGACRHKPRFHRFDTQDSTASTDESYLDERVKRLDSTKSTSSTFSASTAPTASPSPLNDASFFNSGEQSINSEPLQICYPVIPTNRGTTKPKVPKSKSRARKLTGGLGYSEAKPG